MIIDTNRLREAIKHNADVMRAEGLFTESDIDHTTARQLMRLDEVDILHNATLQPEF